MKSFSSRLTSGRGVACPPAFLPSRGRRPAREIATRELRSEWSISRPALALPPPTSAAVTPLLPRRPRGGLQSGVRVLVLALPPPTGAAATPYCPAVHAAALGGASQEPWCSSAVSHAIPPVRIACSYQFMLLSHSGLGIAWDFGEGGAYRGVWGGGGV